MLPQAFYTLRTLVYLANMQPATNNTEAALRNFDLLGSSSSLPSGLDAGSIACYGEIGCFGLEDPWTSAVRPNPILPQSPDVIKPTFLLFTRENPIEYQEAKATLIDTLQESYLNPDNPVYFIVHGFTESSSVPWIKIMVDELLAAEDCNVFVMDWRYGSMPPYLQAATDSRVVGHVLGYMILVLQERFQVDPSQCSVIGHSLGSHIAGYAGTFLKMKSGRKLGRIIGLDPAEPYFDLTDDLVQLDPSDASLVDIIHTDAANYYDTSESGPGKFGFGTFRPGGHLDFYPNGGVVMPGCEGGLQKSLDEYYESILKGLRHYFNCNHFRAVEYFTESIRSTCPFLGLPCTSWDAFVAGECGSCDDGVTECVPMGFRAKTWMRKGSSDVGQGQQRLKLYLQTRTEKPYCGYQYRVQITISGNDKSFQNGEEQGSFQVILKDSQGQTSEDNFATKKNGGFFYPNQVYTFVTAAALPLKNITDMTVTWNSNVAALNPFTWHTLLKTTRVFVSRISVENVASGERFLFCFDEEEELSSGNSHSVRSIVNSELCPRKQQLDDHSKDRAGQQKHFQRWLNMFGFASTEES